MKRKLRFRREALAEALEARNWYEEQRQGLGKAFALALEARVEAVRDNPFRFPLILDNARHARLRRFPYTVIFRVSDGEILVIAVMHDRRSVDAWQARLN